MKKLYKINSFSQLNTDHILIKSAECYPYNSHEITLYITEDIADKISKIKIIKKFNKHRNYMVPLEYILDCIYKELPELFEY